MTDGPDNGGGEGLRCQVRGGVKAHGLRVMRSLGDRTRLASAIGASEGMAVQRGGQPATAAAVTAGGQAASRQRSARRVDGGP